MHVIRASRARDESGFTLIELVLVMVISAILSGLLGSFVSRPMEGYRDLTLRAALVDEAEVAIRRVARDVRAAVPNSLRVSTDGLKLELLHAVDGARYRAGPGTNPSTSVVHTAASDLLSLTGDTQFNVTGRLNNLSYTYGSALASGHRLAIYSAGSWVWSDAATSANPGVITPSATTITVQDDSDEDQFLLDSSFTFRFGSPRQRVFVVDTPLSLICNTTAETLTRYTSYAIASTQPENPALAPLSTASSAPLSRDISACSFLYDPGTPSRAGLLTISLHLTRTGEQVRLLHQVHVNNAP